MAKQACTFGENAAADFLADQYNQKLMEDVGASGTPAIYYLNHANMLQQIVGLPDREQMANLIACK